MTTPGPTRQSTRRPVRQGALAAALVLGLGGCAQPMATKEIIGSVAGAAAGA